MVVFLLMVHFKQNGRYQPSKVSELGFGTFDTQTGIFHIINFSEEGATITINPLTGEVTGL